MTDLESFKLIDDAIESFKQKEGSHKRIKVSTHSQGNWVVFNWRQLTWTENDIHYLIEVYPSFDNQENITDWNLYAAAFYDRDKKRYYTKKYLAENTPLDFIAGNTGSLILEAYQFLSNIKREQIPFAVDLK